MIDSDKPRQKRERGQPSVDQPFKPNHHVEKDSAVERGKRIDTGKIIARDGKREEHVPGATEQKK